MNNLITSLILSFWLIFIAVFSIQNVEQVNLQFLNFKSISISTGVIMSFSLAGGFLLGGITPLFFKKKKLQKSSTYRIKNKSKVNRKPEPELKREWEEKDPIFDWE